ncbi:MAG: hypothetical protein JO208_05405 [Alphaproteobacteria bacterium]|nr:hypothetical protein [Alphaproteobacteria bacterium]
MKLSLSLVGFDRETEELGVEYPIPDRAVEAVMRLVAPRETLDELGDDIPVSLKVAKEVGLLIQRRVPTDGLEFFLEISAPAGATLPKAARAHA